MGVRFYDSEDMFSDDDYTTTSCYSCSCKSTCQKSNQTETKATNNGNGLNVNNLTLQKSNLYKDIVGNCKEVRIEENSYNLRIIGNNNRIRITLNMGDLIVIGNNTRLKIKTNHGDIKYTGNDGRISLGNDSKQQLVNYIGCNGILKVVNSMNLIKQKCTNKNATTTSENKCINKQFIGNNTKTTNTLNYKNINNNKSKEKSHSYGGSTNSNSDHNKWQQFNNLFNNKKSMPNLATPNYCHQMLPPTNVIQNIGSIVIADSSNICITPYSRNITTQA